MPEGIAVDSKGNVFVADRGNKRVQEFNSSIAWIRNISQAEPMGTGLYDSGRIVGRVYIAARETW